MRPDADARPLRHPRGGEARRAFLRQNLSGSLENRCDEVGRAGLLRPFSRGNLGVFGGRSWGSQANANRKCDEFVVFLARPENALNPKLDSPHDHPHRRPARAPPGSSVRRGGCGRAGHRRRIRRSLRRRAGAHVAEQDRLSRALRTDEESSARRVARDRRAALHAGAKLGRADDRRVRDLVRHLDPAPRRGLAGQWRRPPDHQRVRAIQGGAGARQPRGRAA